MRIVMVCEVVFAALKYIKTEIYAIQHKAYSRKQGHVCHFSEKEQQNVKKAQVENLGKNVLKKCR